MNTVKQGAGDWRVGSRAVHLWLAASGCCGALALTAGCFSSSSSGAGPGVNFDSGSGDVGFGCSQGPCDASVMDATEDVVDAGVDSTASEASTDAGVDATDSAVLPFDASACVDSGTGFCMLVLANNQGNAASTQIDSANVYWVQEATGAVMKVPINGGTPQTIAVGGGGVSFITIDGASVYFANQYNGEVMKAPLDGDGGQTVTLSSVGTGASPAGVAVDAVNLYWTNLNGGTIDAVPIGGGSTTTLASGITFPLLLTLDSQNVYVTCGDGTILSIPKAGGDGGIGNVIVSGQGGDGISGIAVDSQHVYWSNNAVDGGIFMAPLGGGSPTQLVGSQNQAGSIAVDTANVYWVTSLNPGGIVAMAPLTGGTPVTLATGQTQANGIVVNSTDVFWSDFAFGKVLQVVK
jgi:sugar lactone lactonase YvrE